MKLSEIYNKQVSIPRPAGKPKPPAFKPSALGTPCMRKLYYSYNRVPEDYGLPLNVLRICDVGNWLHEMLTDAFKKSGTLLKDELRLVDKELEVSAYIDGVFEIDGKLWLAEYKTINSNGFNKLRGPKSEHKTQGVSYLYLFNRALKDGAYPEYEKYGQAEGVIFLYVNKNNSEMKEFSLTEDDEEFMSIIEKMEIVKEANKNNTLPPKTQDWCQSCNWRDKCEKNYVLSHPNSIV